MNIITFLYKNIKIISIIYNLGGLFSLYQDQRHSLNPDFEKSRKKSDQW